jgi:RNA polymerase sigma factor (TIGR02999 family)
MRTVLVDHARARAAAKRGGDYKRVPLDALLVPFEEKALDVLALDEALANLAKISPQAARVVELRFFGGLEQADVASVLGVSVSSVERDWRMARAWLRRELEETEPESP